MEKKLQFYKALETGWTQYHDLEFSCGHTQSYPDNSQGEELDLRRIEARSCICDQCYLALIRKDPKAHILSLFSRKLPNCRDTSPLSRLSDNFYHACLVSTIMLEDHDLLTWYVEEARKKAPWMEHLALILYATVFPDKVKGLLSKESLAGATVSAFGITWLETHDPKWGLKFLKKLPEYRKTWTMEKMKLLADPGDAPRMMVDETLDQNTKIFAKQVLNGEYQKRNEERLTWSPWSAT